jgi:hypothetical protein
MNDRTTPSRPFGAALPDLLLARGITTRMGTPTGRGSPSSSLGSTTRPCGRPWSEKGNQHRRSLKRSATHSASRQRSHRIPPLGGATPVRSARGWLRGGSAKSRRAELREIVKSASKQLRLNVPISGSRRGRPSRTHAALRRPRPPPWDSLRPGSACRRSGSAAAHRRARRSRSCDSPKGRRASDGR